jgi:hypothetical protein
VANTEYKSQAARDAERIGYGDKSYWDYLDQSEQEMFAKGWIGNLDRTLMEALAGNDGE